MGTVKKVAWQGHGDNEIITLGRLLLSMPAGCLDSGAKKVLLPITSEADLGDVPVDFFGSFNVIFYNSDEDAVFKALGVK